MAYPMDGIDDSDSLKAEGDKSSPKLFPHQWAKHNRMGIVIAVLSALALFSLCLSIGW